MSMRFPEGAGVLAADYTAGATSMQVYGRPPKVNSGDSWLLRIDGEMFLVTSSTTGTPYTFTVVPAQGGTASASHASGTGVWFGGYATNLRWTGDWSSSISYDQNDIASYGGALYLSLYPGNAGNAPGGVWWSLIPTSPTSAEGDLIVRGASGDSRLAIGLSGQVPVVDTSVPGKIRWSNPSVVVSGTALTPPVDPDFSWVNQGGATVTVTSGGISLTAPGSASDSLRCRERAIPAAPYTATIGFLATFKTTDFAAAGMYIRDSSSGKIVTHHLSFATSIKIDSVKYASTTSVTGGGSYGSLPALTLGVVFLRIKDDGTNRTFWISSDGVNFIQTNSVSRIDWFGVAPDRIGFFANSINSSPVCINVLHWVLN